MTRSGACGPRTMLALVLGLLVTTGAGGLAQASPGPTSDEIDNELASGDRVRIAALDERLAASTTLDSRARRADVQRALALIERDEQPGRALLQIRNHTPYRTYIFVDGALTGWVGPYATYTLRGFVQSYYTLYIRTYYGTRYWGPRTMHLSGIYHLW